MAGLNRGTTTRPSIISEIPVGLCCMAGNAALAGVLSRFGAGAVSCRYSLGASPKSERGFASRALGRGGPERAGGGVECERDPRGIVAHHHRHFRPFSTNPTESSAIMANRDLHRPVSGNIPAPDAFITIRSGRTGG